MAMEISPRARFSASPCLKLQRVPFEPTRGQRDRASNTAAGRGLLPATVSQKPFVSPAGFAQQVCVFVIDDFMSQNQVFSGTEAHLDPDEKPDTHCERQASLAVDGREFERQFPRSSGLSSAVVWYDGSGGSTAELKRQAIRER